MSKWLSRIFKGSSHNFSEGHYRGNYGDNSNYYAPSTSSVAWSEQENEDIDRAIALSLLEENHGGRTVVNNETQLEEDEQLANALKEKLEC